MLGAMDTPRGQSSRGAAPTLFIFSEKAVRVAEAVSLGLHPQREEVNLDLREFCQNCLGQGRLSSLSAHPLDRILGLHLHLVQSLHVRRHVRPAVELRDSASEGTSSWTS